MKWRCLWEIPLSSAIEKHFNNLEIWGRPIKGTVNLCSKYRHWGRTLVANLTERRQLEMR